MIVRFAGPLAKMMGTKECSISIKPGDTVSNIIGILASRFSDTEFFCEGIVQEDFIPCVWMAIKNGRVLLNLDDLVDDSDEIEFIPPIMGG